MRMHALPVRNKPNDKTRNHTAAGVQKRGHLRKKPTLMFCRETRHDGTYAIVEYGFNFREGCSKAVAEHGAGLQVVPANLLAEHGIEILPLQLSCLDLGLYFKHHGLDVCDAAADDAEIEETDGGALNGVRNVVGGAEFAEGRAEEHAPHRPHGAVGQGGQRASKVDQPLLYACES